MSTQKNNHSVRAAVVQAGAVPFDSEACVDKAVRLIAEASALGAKVIVFPEAFIPGYPKGVNYGLVVGARDPAGREEFRLYLEAAIEVPGPETLRLGEAAVTHAAYVVMGVIERDKGTCYCTVLPACSQAPIWSASPCSMKPRRTKDKTFEIGVHFDDGNSRSFHQESHPSWKQGSRVKLVNGALTSL